MGEVIRGELDGEVTNKIASYHPLKKVMNLSISKGWTSRPAVM